MQESPESIAQQLVSIWAEHRDTSQALAAAASGDQDELGLGIAHPCDYAYIGADEQPLTMSTPKHPVIVAEGDSWFDYPVKGDLLDALRRKHGYTIYELSKAGALVEDMVYGSERRFWGKLKPQIIRCMETVAQRRPSIVLLSGGGNDIAGDELAALINRKAENVPHIRDGVVDHIMNVVFRRAYLTFIHTMHKVAEREGFSLTVVGHTYDFPNPDGRGFSLTNIIPGFKYVGPWLKPAFTRKGYPEDQAREAVSEMLLKFKAMQLQLQSELGGKFRFVDLQGTLDPVSKTDWDNEMHPTWSGFKRCAERVHAVIESV